MTAQPTAYEILTTEMMRNTHLVEAVTTVPDYQHDDGELDQECEDCGAAVYDCRCADLCQWTDRDGAPKCREPKDDWRDEWCAAHTAEADSDEAADYDAAEQGYWDAS